MTAALAEALPRLTIGDDAGSDVELAGQTPARWWRALKEMTRGYSVWVPDLFTTFEVRHPIDEMVVVSGIDFVSVCEHHLLPFLGTATVAYLPGRDGRVVGLSKLARVVDAYAQRFQMQERLTQQVAGAIDRHLTPAGVGVILRAHHQCLGCRGARKANAVMTTSTLLGRFRDPAVRAELLALERA